MSILRKIILFSLVGAIFLLPAHFLLAQEKEKNLDTYLEYFYNRYSRHFDLKGLEYINPSYGITAYKKAQTFREWAALASYYKYRAMGGDKQANNILREALIKGINELKSRPAYSQSFCDAEAIFLTLRITDDLPDLLNNTQKNDFLSLVKNNIETGIKARDSENRALVAGSHWQYISDYLYTQKIINLTEKNYYSRLIKNKIDAAIKESVNDKYWYFEGQGKYFSVHYQAVSAFMLLWYADQTGQEYYKNISRMMYINTKKISFYNGMVEAQIGRRPPGLGAQFYLMMGLVGKYFNDDDYRVYLFYGGGNRFFSNKQYPNQLEYHATIEGSSPNYHDDYAFSDAGEIGLVIEKTNGISLNPKYYFTNPVSKTTDKYFNIINNKTSININNKKLILGSYGNWSKLINQ